MSREPAWPWSVLNLPKKPDALADVRRAYARALKQIDQGKDIAAFTALRMAYEEATRRMAMIAARQKVTDVAPPIPALPPDSRDDDTTPFLPVNLIAENPQTARKAAFAALLDRMRTFNAVEYVGDRILRALADPLADDPDFQPILRQQIASLLRDQTRADGEGGLYLSLSLRPVMQELDRRFQWLSDYTAFRRDFWDNPLLLDAMMACAGMRPAAATPHTPPGRKKGPIEQRLTTTLGSGLFWLGYAILTIALGAVGNTDLGKALGWRLGIVFFVVIVTPLAIACVMFAVAVVRTVISGLRREYERRQDRRALRRKGKVVAGNRGFNFRAFDGTGRFVLIFFLLAGSQLLRAWLD
jgi:hypothetical protein